MKVQIFIFLLVLQSCISNGQQIIKEKSTEIEVGAEQLKEYLPLLEKKKVALVVNQTSLIKNTHLVDTLLSHNIEIVRIFAPEHGFRGEASAGETVKNEIDKKTNLPLLSLYGKNKKPTKEQLNGIDVIVFDIQDVGVRFYTYISTLNYVLEAAAENNVSVIVLDRPNPNGHYVDGPVLEKEFKSFVGIAPIPVVHGCTIGELAKMFVGEKWIKQAENAQLTVIQCKNYDHSVAYDLPVKPSPNLPNRQAILLYPSICYFEPTAISVGRGTDLQFQVIGGPDKKLGKFIFTPIDKEGAIDPVNENIKCYGINLQKIQVPDNQIDLSYLIKFYHTFSNKEKFFSSESFFNKLIGNSWVLDYLKKGKTEQQMRNRWQADLNQYKKLRTKYLLYN